MKRIEMTTWYYQKNFFGELALREDAVITSREEILVNALDKYFRWEKNEKEVSLRIEIAEEAMSLTMERDFSSYERFVITINSNNNTKELKASKNEAKKIIVKFAEGI